MKQRGTWKSVWTLASIIMILSVYSGVLAYDRYSVDGSTGNCSTCHGDFRATSYSSLKDGQTWPDNLHDVHRYDMLNGDCDTCHSTGGRSPVYLSSSNGGTGLDPISCVGCHGRAADATGGGTTGYGVGLRQHHYRAGQTSCASCHSDANPAMKVTVAENILPPYYSSIDPSHPTIPSDPCNPEPGYPENYAASTLGLDNDGDDSYDTADGDCVITNSTPGEVSGPNGILLTVEAFDSVGGTMTISFDPACSGTSENIEWGPLSQISTYGYQVQTSNECSIGGSPYIWSYPDSEDNIFFLVVANDGAVEGSYGTDSTPAERPEHQEPGGLCNVDQDLNSRCD